MAELSVHGKTFWPDSTKPAKSSDRIYHDMTILVRVSSAILFPRAEKVRLSVEAEKWALILVVLRLTSKTRLMIRYWDWIIRKKDKPK